MFHCTRPKIFFNSHNFLFQPLVDSPGSRGEIGWNNFISDKKDHFFSLMTNILNSKFQLVHETKNKPKSPSELHSHLSTHLSTHTPRQNTDALHISLSWKPKGQDLTGERLSSISGEKTDFVVWHELAQEQAIFSDVTG